jgi:exodeoxyribonuclease VII large subunit
MQGDESERSIIAAMHAVSGDLFDVVVIIRGGGAAGDLASFDNYLLCSHIARFPLPVITGIGHDKDLSIADMVASVSLKTPTAVAGWLVSRAATMEYALDGLASQLVRNTERIIEREKGLVSRLSLTLSQASIELARGLELRLERLASELTHRINIAVERGQTAMERFNERLTMTARETITRQRFRLESAGKEVEGRNPANILALGFSLVRHNGRLVRSVEEVSEGERLKVSLKDGKIETKIEQIWKNRVTERQ